MDQQKLGETLKLLCKNKNISQEELSSVIKVSRQSLSSWERGETAPDIFNLQALAKFYGLSMDDILNSNIVFNSIDIKDIYNEERDNLIKSNSKKLKVIKNAIYFLGLLSVLSYVILLSYLLRGDIVYTFKATFLMTMPMIIPILITLVNLVQKRFIILNICALIIFFINVIMIAIINFSSEISAIFLVILIPIYMFSISAVLLLNYKTNTKEITNEKK